jgi:hypothetical protein
MTHDELLEKITLKFVVNEEGATESGTKASQLRDALRAVVELHKPSEQDFPDEPEHCTGCQEIALGDYPCPTIQAIEKELA